jgi:hypothetical protein
MSPQKVDRIVAALGDRELTAEEFAAALGVKLASFYKIVQHARDMLDVTYRVDTSGHTRTFATYRLRDDMPAPRAEFVMPPRQSWLSALGVAP